MRHFVLVIAAAFYVACQTPASEPDVEPATLTEPASPAPPSPLSCDALHPRIIGGQWPDPQWLSLSDDSSLLSGGWTSISTGRFGSASWEHCSTFTVFRGEDTIPLQGSNHELAGLAPVQTQQCRTPDGILGGELYDFHMFSRYFEDGFTREQATEKIGWTPAFGSSGHWTFDTLSFFRGGAWRDVGFPADGLHPGWRHTALADGDLLVAGGFFWVPVGENAEARPVGQSAVWDIDDQVWHYTDNLDVPRYDHALVPFGRDAFAIGGRADQSGKVGADTIERFDDATRQWSVVATGVAPFLSPAATPVGDRIAIVESEGQGSFVLFDPAAGTWTFPHQPPLAHTAPASLLSHPTGDLVLVVPAGVAIYDIDADRWTACDIPYGVEGIEVEGSGPKTWGPAHLTADGRLLLTRIDRDRWYDY